MPPTQRGRVFGVVKKLCPWGHKRLSWKVLSVPRGIREKPAERMLAQSVSSWALRPHQGADLQPPFLHEAWPVPCPWLGWAFSLFTA